MSGLQAAKLTFRGSPMTLISFDKELIKECERVLQNHFSRKSPVFSEADEAEVPQTLGSFQIASALFVDIDSLPLPDNSSRAEYEAPISHYYPPEIETNAAAFTDEIDRVEFSPPTPECCAVFAPVIAEVRSLNATHPDDWWPKPDCLETVWHDVGADNTTPCVKPELRDWHFAHATLDVQATLNTYTCSSCGTAVACANRAAHERLHAVQCRECGWEFKSARALTSHMKAHRYKQRRKKHLHSRWRKTCKSEFDHSPIKVSIKESCKKRRRRVKGQPPGRLLAALRSRDAPPVLLPFDADLGDLDASEAKGGGRRNRPRDPLSVPLSAPPVLSPLRGKPFVSVLSVESFVSITAGVQTPSASRSVNEAMSSKHEIAAEVCRTRELAAAEKLIAIAEQSQAIAIAEQSQAVAIAEKSQAVAIAEKSQAIAIVKQSAAEVRISSETASAGRNGVVGRRKNGFVSATTVANPSDQIPVVVQNETAEGDSRSPVSGKTASRACTKRPRSRFACSKCKTVFGNVEDRRKHLRTHRIPCNYCPARFLNQQYVDLHRKIFHPESLELGLAGLETEEASRKQKADFEEDVAGNGASSIWIY